MSLRRNRPDLVSLPLGLICLLCTGAPGLEAQCGVLFRRADSNSDGTVDISDGVNTLGHLFLNRGIPKCLDAADADDSGTIDLTDAVFTFLALFAGGPPPPPPGHLQCGVDPSADDLGCASGAPCEDAGVDCPPGFYCATPPGDCAGPGTCAEMPPECNPDAIDPVCGCDGETYTNDCFAAWAGVGIAHEGRCISPPCRSNADCARGMFCAKSVGDCDGEGGCRERPAACPAVFDPVCGCDGRTYGNSCEAAAAGVSVAHEGECTSASCGTGGACPPGSYCEKPIGECSGEGKCTERPTICPDVFDPVCGCDGATYGNSCEAASAGVNVAHRGECAPGG